MMSLPTASRKAIHFARWSFAGDATAYSILCLNPHSGCFFALLRTTLRCSRTHIKLKSSAAQPLPRHLATVDAPNSP